MSKNENNSGKSLYEQQENKLSQQSAAFIDFLNASLPMWRKSWIIR